MGSTLMNKKNICYLIMLFSFLYYLLFNINLLYAKNLNDNIFNKKLKKKELSSHKNIINDLITIIKYSPQEKNEKVVAVNTYSGGIEYQKGFIIKDINTYDRNLRFINSSKDFVYIKSKPSDRIKFYDYSISSDKRKPDDIQVFLGSKNLTTKKEGCRLIYDWDNRSCKYFDLISERLPEFYLTTQRDEIAIVNLYFSRFDGIIFFLQTNISLNNDFIGNISSNKEKDLPINPASSVNGKIVSYYFK